MKIMHQVINKEGKIALETNDYQAARRFAGKTVFPEPRPWLVLVCIVAAMFAAYTAGCRSAKPAYYDGEGNPIPDEVVRLHIASQFVHISKQEQRKIDAYFYTK